MEQIKLPRCMTPSEVAMANDSDILLYYVEIEDLLIRDSLAEDLGSYAYEETELCSGLFKTDGEASKFLELYKSNSIVFDTERETWVLRANIVIPEESILLEAFNIINGSRNSDYKGTEGFEKISEIWNKLYPNKPLTAYDISMVMVVLKLVRESSIPKRDNLVDACGYLHFANQLTNK